MRLSLSDVNDRITYISDLHRKLDKFDLNASEKRLAAAHTALDDQAVKISSLSVEWKRLEKEVAEIALRCDEAVRSLNRALGAVDQHSIEWNNWRTMIESALDNVQHQSEDVRNLEQKSEATKRFCEDMTSELNQSVMTSLERISDEQARTLTELRSSLSRSVSDSSGDDRLLSVFKYCRKMIAEHRYTYYAKNSSHQILFAWHWEGVQRAKRKLSLDRLRSLINSHAKTHLRKWHNTTRYEALFDAFDQRLKAEIATISSFVDEHHLEPEIQNLKTELNVLRQRPIGEIQDEVKGIYDSIEETRNYTDTRVRSIDERFQAIDPQLDTIQSCIEGFSRRLDEIATSKSLYATVENFKEVFADIVMLWNNVKHLDAIKVDSREVKELITASERPTDSQQQSDLLDRLLKLEQTVAHLSTSVESLQKPLQHNHDSHTIITREQSTAIQTPEGLKATQSIDDFMNYARSVMNSATGSRNKGGRKERPLTTLHARGYQVVAPSGLSSRRSAI